MRATAIMVVLLGVTYAVPATACHRFSRWYYPTPQRCSVANKVAHAVYRPPFHTMVYHPVPYNGNVNSERVAPIPLPDMNVTWGGAMDTELELSLQRQKAIRQLSQGGD